MECKIDLEKAQKLIDDGADEETDFGDCVSADNEDWGTPTRA